MRTECYLVTNVTAPLHVALEHIAFGVERLRLEVVSVVPMAPVPSGGKTGGLSVLFSLPKKSGEGC